MTSKSLPYRQFNLYFPAHEALKVEAWSRDFVVKRRGRILGAAIIWVLESHTAAQLRVALATEHIPLTVVVGSSVECHIHVSVEGLELIKRMAYECACRRDRLCRLAILLAIDAFPNPTKKKLT